MIYAALVNRLKTVPGCSLVHETGQIFKPSKDKPYVRATLFQAEPVTSAIGADGHQTLIGSFQIDLFKASGQGDDYTRAEAVKQAFDYKQPPIALGSDLLRFHMSYISNSRDLTDGWLMTSVVVKWRCGR